LFAEKREIGQRLLIASWAGMSTEKKDLALNCIAGEIDANRKTIKAENSKDLNAGKIKAFQMLLLTVLH